jgi:hypothetical protein
MAGKIPAIFLKHNVSSAGRLPLLLRMFSND